MSNAYGYTPPDAKQKRYLKHRKQYIAGQIEATVRKYESLVREAHRLGVAVPTKGITNA